jgi:hypothetical protein
MDEQTKETVNHDATDWRAELSNKNDLIGFSLRLQDRNYFHS